MAAVGDIPLCGSGYSYNTTNTTMEPCVPTSPTEQPETPYPVYVGYICALITVLLYGSNFVPVKKYYTGDGMFFQFILCNGIFLGGIVVQLLQNSKFFPLAMVGGVIWATGNLGVVPIIKAIGMGLGISLWGTVALVTGWASGKFGWFGMDKDKISHVGLNYGGVVLAAFSILLLVLVKDEISSAKPEDEGDETQVAPLSQQSSIQDNDKLPPDTECEDRIFVEDFTPKTKKLTGILLSLACGVCFGITFCPSIYVQDNYGHEGATKNGLDYVFAHYSGIYLASSVYFYIYCLIKRNSPKVYPHVILPGLMSGILWAIATACCFVANAELSQSVSFPIISTGPSAVASLFWGVCVFKEVQGLRNILILLASFVVMTTGALLSGFSK